MVNTTQPTSNAPEQDKTLAILSLVFAILFPLVGLILAIIAKKKYPEGVDGHKLVKAALIVSIILLSINVLAVIFMISGLFMMGSMI